MPKKFKKKQAEPDPRYNSVLVGKLVNQIMRRGKKTVARKIVYSALELIKEKSKRDPLEILESAVNNASPLLEIKPKRVGGATYQIPREVKGDRRLTLAMRWILTGAKARKAKSMAEKLSVELLDAANNLGWAIKRKEDTHKMAEANRAFAHFSW
jgi:small subunit ribosomal protein S7